MRSAERGTKSSINNTVVIGAVRRTIYPVGDAENAGLENAGLENVGPNRRSGKGRTGKRGNIMCMGSEM